MSANGKSVSEEMNISFRATPAIAKLGKNLGLAAILGGGFSLGGLLVESGYKMCGSAYSEWKDGRRERKEAEGKKPTKKKAKKAAKSRVRTRKSTKKKTASKKKAAKSD